MHLNGIFREDFAHLKLSHNEDKMQRVNLHEQGGIYLA